jgi:ribosomal protein S18 acetylase RimI-like enzyme
MLIRAATADDVPQVLPMVEQLCALHENWDAARYGVRDNVGEMYRNWLTERAGDASSVFLVAEIEQNQATPISPLAAFLIATTEREIPIYRLKRYGFIHDLWVEADYRHEGIARQLTMLAVERFGAMGIRQIRLDTARQNDAARALFAGCGFRESTRQMLLEL